MSSKVYLKASYNNYSTGDINKLMVGNNDLKLTINEIAGRPFTIKKGAYFTLKFHIPKVWLNSVTIDPLINHGNWTYVPDANTSEIKVMANENSENNTALSFLIKSIKIDGGSISGFNVDFLYSTLLENNSDGIFTKRVDIKNSTSISPIHCRMLKYDVCEEGKECSDLYYLSDKDYPEKFSIEFYIDDIAIVKNIPSSIITIKLPFETDKSSGLFNEDNVKRMDVNFHSPYNRIKPITSEADWNMGLFTIKIFHKTDLVNKSETGNTLFKLHFNNVFISKPKKENEYYFFEINHENIINKIEYKKTLLPDPICISFSKTRIINPNTGIASNYYDFEWDIKFAVSITLTLDGWVQKNHEPKGKLERMPQGSAGATLQATGINGKTVTWFLEKGQTKPKKL